MTILNLIAAALWFGWFVGIVFFEVVPPVVLAAATTGLLAYIHFVEALVDADD